MVKFWSLATAAAVCIAAATSVDAQNAAVHAPNILGATTATTKPAAAAATPAKASTTATKPAAAGTTAATKPTAAGTTTATKPTAAATAGTTAATKPTAGTAASTTPASKVTLTPPPQLAASATWVSNFKAKAKQPSCYRRTALGKNHPCPEGFIFDGKLVCWAQCPIDYPVQCGMECLPQNKDCTLNILDRVSAAAAAAVKTATGGFFGELVTVAKGITRGVSCAQKLYDASIRLSEFVDQMDAATKTGPREKIAALVDKSDLVAYDIPLIVTTCLGETLPEVFKVSKQVLSVVRPLVAAILDKTLSKENIKDKLKYLDFLKKFMPGGSSANTTQAAAVTAAPAAATLPALTKAEIDKFGKSGNTCGQTLSTYVGKVQDEVTRIMKSQPTADHEYLQYAMLSSPIVLTDLPTAASSCGAGLGSATTQADLVTALQVIVDKIIASAFDKSGVLAKLDGYKLQIAHFGLVGLSVIDPTGITTLVDKFLRPICNAPTINVAIQDGPADKALGMEAVQKAFNGSTGTWTTKGDGMLTINFQSTDKYDVRVNIISGGTKIKEFPVAAGATAKFTAPLKTLAGKTLYLDRWRKGILGIPGTGGGSLLLWVPNNAAGSIVLKVPINKTKFFDKETAVVK